MTYIFHELSANFHGSLGKSGWEHHNLLFVGGFVENALDHLSHVYDCKRSSRHLSYQSDQEFCRTHQGWRIWVYQVSYVHSWQGQGLFLGFQLQHVEVLRKAWVCVCRLKLLRRKSHNEGCWSTFLVSRILYGFGKPVLWYEQEQGIEDYLRMSNQAIGEQRERTLQFFPYQILPGR